MKIYSNSKSRSAGTLGILALVAIVVLTPNAFAQQSSMSGMQSGSSMASGSTPGSMTSDQVTSDPNAVYGWSAGIAVAGAMSGVGAWTAIRRK
jgi:hypothetical protein